MLYHRTRVLIGDVGFALSAALSYIATQAPLLGKVGGNQQPG
jgi:hypothetical protein